MQEFCVEHDELNREWIIIINSHLYEPAKHRRRKSVEVSTTIKVINQMIKNSFFCDKFEFEFCMRLFWLFLKHCDI